MTEVSPANHVSPFQLHVDCSGGISARSLLDGLRALARSGATEHAEDAFELDPVTATLWMKHIPDADRAVLQEGSRLSGKETPIESWEPFRKAIREASKDGSLRLVEQLQDLLDAIQLFYDEEVERKFPLFPSVVWHMIAVVILLDRMHIKSMTSSALPRNPRYPSILDLILKKFPVMEQDDENSVNTTTFDGAILLYVLKPATQDSPDLVFHSKAVGRDTMIQTELGLIEENTVAEAGPPPEMAPRSVPVATKKGDEPPELQLSEDDETIEEEIYDEETIEEVVESTHNEEEEVVSLPPTPVQERRVVQPIPQAAAKQAPVHQEQHRPVERAVAQRSPQPTEEKEANPLESPLWNVDEDLALLQTNIDDMTPEHLAFVANLLLEQGAADTWLNPILMKKGRPGTELNCLCHDDKRQELLITIFRQTTTLGVRVWTSTCGLKRVSLRREMITVEYCRRPIPVKVAYLGNDPVSIKPEFEQCAQLSKDTQIPIINVTEEVKALAKDAARRKLLAMI